MTENRIQVADPRAFADWFDQERAFALAVERREARWYALLMDFDITGVGATRQDAIEQAFDLLTAYLVAYFEDGQPFSAALRPIPRLLRARIRLETSIGRLVRRLGGRQLAFASEDTYTVPPSLLPCFSAA